VADFNDVVSIRKFLRSSFVFMRIIYWCKSITIQ